MTRPARTLPTAALRLTGQLLRAAAALIALVALVGALPWGLWHFVGWPLPRGVPSGAEISARLTGPLDDSLLLDILACLLWPLWAAFVISVLRAVLDVVRAARWPTPHRRGPSLPTGGLHGLATFLLGAVLLTALHARVPLTPTGGPAGATAAATAPAAPRLLAVDTASPIDTTQQPAAAGIVIVELPANGVYDSLWRIAQRTLGDGARWPEIWTLNQGTPQADGRALHQPGLIRPGWTLRLPVTADQSQAHPSAPQPPASTPSSPPTLAAPPAPLDLPATPALPPPSPGAASASPSATPHPPPTQAPAPPTTVSAAPTSGQPGAVPTRSPGVHLPNGGYLGLGAVALLTAALFTRRLWRRRHERSGVGLRDELVDAPVIRDLATAYNRATADGDDDGEAVYIRPPGDPHVVGRRHAQSTAQVAAGPPGTQIVGTAPDGQPLALDLAATRGLGLIGPGADAAIRALLLAALAERHRPGSAPVEILIPAADARRMLGEEAAADPPQRLHLVADLDVLLDRLDSEIITRARLAADEDADRSTLIVVAAPEQTRDRRLQMVLDNGSALGVVGVLYGQWRPGATARVRADGIVGAASPSVAAALTGSRLFTLPEADTLELLGLLRDADPAAANQEAYRAANPTPGPPPPPPAYEPPPDISPAPERAAEIQPAPRHTEPPGDTSPPDVTATSGASPLARTPTVPPDLASFASTPLRLTLCGATRLLYRPGDGEDYQPVDGVGPKARELIAYLALHPDGARRDALLSALWPDSTDTRRRLDNRFYAAASQLRRTLRTATGNAIGDIIEQHDGRYQLNRDLLDVDVWQIQIALDQARRAPTATERLTALLPVTAHYTGHLTADLAGVWAETHRENLRRQVVDSLGTVTATLGQDDLRRLDLLEALRRLDPLNEQVYQQIADTQARLGLHDAVARTYALLLASLAEIGQQPSRDTEDVFRTLTRSGRGETRSA